ncbi:MAG: hypothetical protein JO038_06030 [Alphaproteobacteria bacterium]|nr:hypothetical protein [Alphaproteobacteria bacterium]
MNEAAGEGALVDTDTGVLRRDRVLVQRGPGALVVLGAGPRAGHLCRFAFAAADGVDPFLAACQAVDEAIERGDLAKAAEHGIPPALRDIAYRPLRPLGDRRIPRQGRL